MTARTRSAHELELVAKAGRYLAGGTLGNLVEDVILARGRGSRVWDVSGHEYIDYLLGLGADAGRPRAPGGRGRRRTSSSSSARRSSRTTSAPSSSPRRSRKAMPCAEKMRFCSSGTEATLYAMRVARAFRRRDRILKFEGGFHGMHDYAVMGMSPPAPGPVPGGGAGLGRHSPGRRVDDARRAVQRSRDDGGHRRPARATSWPAVIVEPFQRVLAPRPGFLAGLRELTARARHPAHLRRGGHRRSGSPTAAPRSSTASRRTSARSARRWAAAFR